MFSLKQLLLMTQTLIPDAEGCCADVWFIDNNAILKRVQTTDIASTKFMEYCLDRP